MIRTYSARQHHLYNSARTALLRNIDLLISLEERLSDLTWKLISENASDFKSDYDEASFLFPFWRHYPPEDRGRKPRADQYPWIEVGEHAIGAKLSRLLAKHFHLRDTGFPTGADQRWIVSSPEIGKAVGSISDSAWLCIDVKSVGPRDDQDHTVLSHNQVSGNGEWNEVSDGIRNRVLRASGLRASHDFFATMPPLLVLSDGTVAPTVTMALKPRYDMIPADISQTRNSGQPLIRIDLVTIPNGLLLCEGPNYIEQYPSLLYPGKDDKGKKAEKRRARIDFEILRSIAPWRVRSLPL